MKKALFLSALIVLAGILILSGCSKESLGTKATETGLNYEDDFGGYNTSDEAPGFGDEVIIDEMTEDAEIETSDDPDLNPIAALDSIDRCGNVRIYYMKILWGMLEYDSTVTDVTDWSGSLTIDRGGIKLVSKIRFEWPGDHIVRPRTDPKKLEWVSYTMPHFDGIGIILYDVSNSTDSTDTENTVTFKTGPYERTFTMSELDSLSEIVEVDEIGNKISFDAYYVPEPDCENGFLRGRWIKKGPRRGVFFGKWINWNGVSRGHLRGHWGINNAGDRVFFGKWISRIGIFKGLLKGTWDYDPATDAANPLKGSFRGVWADKHFVVKGKLGGVWASVPPSTDNNGNNGNMTGKDDEVGGIPNRARGFFHGRWAKFCPEK